MGISSKSSALRRVLLARAGFAPERVTGTKSPFSVIEASRSEILGCEKPFVLRPGAEGGNL
jgi:hypothetical protein